MKHIIIFLFICFLSSIAFGQKAQQTITNIYDTAADQHIGQICSVAGIVNSYKKEKKSKRFLVFCGTNYPDQYFTVIINKGDGPLPTMRSKGNFKGWRVSVTGRIIIYN
jgi:hypothetical protein